MNKKHLRDVAIVTIAVFILVVVFYPLMFSTTPEPAKGPPVELELNK